MARQLRRLIVGVVLGAVVGWLWLRRQQTQEPAMMPAPPTSETDERIVLPTWTEVETTPSAVQGRIILPNGKEAGEAQAVATEESVMVATAPASEITTDGAEQSGEASEAQATETVESDATVAVSEPTTEEVTPAAVTEAADGYCVRCKEQRPMVNVRQYITANKRPALKGECGVCGAGMFKFIKE